MGGLDEGIPAIDTHQSDNKHLFGMTNLMTLLLRFGFLAAWRVPTTTLSINFSAPNWASE
jgi:hypothetical protein